MRRLTLLLGLFSALLWLSCGGSGDSSYDCIVDTDCEGTHICRNGRCVSSSDPCATVQCDPGFRCQDGECVPVDPCATLTCDTPPGDEVCFELPGSCAAGVCNYQMRDDGSTCNDDNLCTTGDACHEGQCVGQAVVCNDPPDNECIDANTLRSFTGTGRCADGACAYDFSDVPCSQGCVDGGCVGDPCAGVICNSPPAPSACYQPAGTCVSGGCQYDYNDGADCDDGDPCRVQDVCNQGICRGAPMPCNNPPDNYCDGDSAVIFESEGACDQGTCSYDSQTVGCANGCTNGACEGDPCVGVNCNTPPNAQCYGADSGSCVDTPNVHCEYQAYDDGTGCVDGDACTVNDSCTGGSCAGTQKVCNTPPANVCQDSNTLLTYQTNGSCSDGDCHYNSISVSCSFGCANGACEGDPCGGVICNVPPAAECLTSNTRRYWTSPGTCSNGVCSYPEHFEECAYGCANGACNACTPDCAGKCGGADDGCGGQCNLPCLTGQWCNAGLCAACDTGAHCGTNCVDCSSSPMGRDCVDGACGCLSEEACPPNHDCVHGECLELVAEDCADGVDNDGDGLTDCEDEDGCPSHTICSHAGTGSVCYLGNCLECSMMLCPSKKPQDSKPPPLCPNDPASCICTPEGECQLGYLPE